MTPKELHDELTRLSEGATPRPWESDSGGTYREAEAQAVMLGGPDDKPQRLFDTLNSDVAVIEHDGDEDGTYYWDSQGQKNFALVESLVNNLPTLLRALSALEALEGVKGALDKIVAWEMPESGRFWDKDKMAPMSYGAAFGSNGERDVIKSFARSALSRLKEAGL